MHGFIEPLREKYKKLESVFCPYLEQEVSFRSRGFKHLIWKLEKGMRSKKIIKQRFEALDFVSEIIQKSGTLQEYENTEKEFFCFIAIVQERKYKVVVMKLGDGSYTFLSIIPGWITGKRDLIPLKNHPEG